MWGVVKCQWVALKVHTMPLRCVSASNNFPEKRCRGFAVPFSQVHRSAVKVRKKKKKNAIYSPWSHCDNRGDTYAGPASCKDLRGPLWEDSRCMDVYVHLGLSTRPAASCISRSAPHAERRMEVMGGKHPEFGRNYAEGNPLSQHLANVHEVGAARMDGSESIHLSTQLTARLQGDMFSPT
jgi:hypothetical protein